MKGVSKDTGRSPRFIDRTGTRNGRLVFTRWIGADHNRQSVWEAQCDCGALTRTIVTTKIQSCGCYRREVAAARQRAKKLPPELKIESIKRSRAKQRYRRRSDPLRAMQSRLSRLHRHAIARVNALKTSPTFDQLGYTPRQFAEHIERQFLPGMSWENMSEWQIDHIIPVATAETLDDVIALNQLPNLRPAWAAENNAKKNKRVFLL